MGQLWHPKIGCEPRMFTWPDMVLCNLLGHDHVTAAPWPDYPGVCNYLGVDLTQRDSSQHITGCEQLPFLYSKGNSFIFLKFFMARKMPWNVQNSFISTQEIAKLSGIFTKEVCTKLWIFHIWFWVNMSCPNVISLLASVCVGLIREVTVDPTFL